MCANASLEDDVVMSLVFSGRSVANRHVNMLIDKEDPPPAGHRCNCSLSMSVTLQMCGLCPSCVFLTVSPAHQLVRLTSAQDCDFIGVCCS